MSQIAGWISGHTLTVLLAVGTVFTCLWLLRFRRPLRVSVPAAIALALGHTLYGVLAVSLFAIIEGMGAPASVGNMSLFGGVFFMPVAYYAAARLTRRDTAMVFDVCTICLIFTLFCARFNCILAGCCRGMVIPGTDGLRWPTRELELVFYAVLLLVLARRVLAGKSRGLSYPIYMMAYGVFRFIVETFRESSSQSLFHIAHLWALVSLCVGASFYFQLHKKKKARR